jgi:cytochrome P450
MQQEMKAQIMKIMSGENEAHKDVNHPTVFHELFNSNLSKKERSIQCLQHEGQTIVSAGMETTKTTLACAMFYILETPTILQTLQDELNEAIPDPANWPSLLDLERLPYLTGCVQEGKLYSKVHIQLFYV